MSGSRLPRREASYLYLLRRRLTKLCRQRSHLYGLAPMNRRKPRPAGTRYWLGDQVDNRVFQHLGQRA